MSKRVNVLTLFTIISVVLIGAVGWWAAAWQADQARSETGRALFTVLNTSQQALRTWVKEHGLVARFWANTPEVNRLVEELLDLSPNVGKLVNAPAQRKLQALLRPVLLGKDYRGFFVIGPEDINIGSSRDINIGARSLLAEKGDFLKRVWGGEIAISSVVVSDVPLPGLSGNLVEGLPTMFIGAPVLDGDGEVIAVFTFRIDPFADFTAILQRGRLGASGETYAFDSDGVLISESRFDEQLRRLGLLRKGQSSILNIFVVDPGADLRKDESSLPKEKRPLTLMAASATSGKSAINTEGYHDYRGISVVGAWTWDSELGLGLATEIDEAEAFRAMKTARAILALMTFLAMGLLVGMYLVFTRSRVRIERSEQRLQEANQELGAFTYTVSHDLRNPLTAIIGYADFLRESCVDRLDGQALDCLAEISASGKGMMALMEDLLTLAKVGQIERPDESFDTREIVKEVVRGLSHEITAVGVSVEVCDLPPLRAPRTLLVEMFENLIGNAVRYGCKAGDRIQVGGERRGDKVRFYVRDHGPGIPTEERGRIFEVFFRGTTGKHKQGTGIGLATVQKIARLFDGSAWVEETPGGGSTFWIEMVDVPAKGE